jgi:hypothetical protein
LSRSPRPAPQNANFSVEFKAKSITTNRIFLACRMKFGLLFYLSNLPRFRSFGLSSFYANLSKINQNFLKAKNGQSYRKSAQNQRSRV